MSKKFYVLCGRNIITYINFFKKEEIELIERLMFHASPWASFGVVAVVSAGPAVKSSHV